MARIGSFDEELLQQSVFDITIVREGWFDEDLLHAQGNLFTQSVSGALNFVSDVFVRVVAKAVIGAVAFTSSLHKLVTEFVLGLIEFGGATNKLVAKFFSGEATFSGWLIRLPDKILAGVMNCSSNIVKRVSKVLAGVVSFIAELLGSLGLQHISIEATLRFSGSIVKVSLLNLLSSLSFTGVSIVKFVGKLANFVYLKYKRLRESSSGK